LGYGAKSTGDNKFTHLEDPGCPINFITKRRKGKAHVAEDNNRKKGTIAHHWEKRRKMKKGGEYFGAQGTQTESGRVRKETGDDEVNCQKNLQPSC